MIVQVDTSDIVIENNKVLGPKPFTIGAFNTELVTKFREHVQTATDNRQQVVPLIVDSYGGSVDCLQAILDIIASASHLSFPIVVSGKAMSCGALITGLGEKGHRFMTPNSRMMLHVVSAGTFGKIDDMQVDVEEATRLNVLLFRRLAKHCGKRQDYFLKIMKQRSNTDWFLTPEEALHYGLIDGIGYPHIVVKPTVETYIHLENP